MSREVDLLQQTWFLKVGSIVVRFAPVVVVAQMDWPFLILGWIPAESAGGCDGVCSNGRVCCEEGEDGERFVSILIRWSRPFGEIEYDRCYCRKSDC